MASDPDRAASPAEEPGKSTPLGPERIRVRRHLAAFIKANVESIRPDQLEGARRRLRREAADHLEALTGALANLTGQESFIRLPTAEQRLYEDLAGSLQFWMERVVAGGDVDLREYQALAAALNDLGGRPGPVGAPPYMIIREQAVGPDGEGEHPAPDAPTGDYDVDRKHFMGLAEVAAIANKKLPRWGDTRKVESLARRRGIKVHDAPLAWGGRTRKLVARRAILAALAQEIGDLKE